MQIQLRSKRVVAPKKKKFSLILKRYWPLYVLALPAFILLIVYKFLPMFGIMIAFKDYYPGSGIFTSEWVGLKWFERMFTWGDFTPVLWNTIVISVLKLLIGFPMPIIIAILLNEMRGQRRKRFFQTVLYMPHFLSWAILAGILFTLFSPQTGVLSYFGIEESIFLNEGSFLTLILASDVWKDSGWGTIVYLAAISGINPELYEAAMIDGANRFQRIWHITIKSIAPTIVILLILKVGHLLNAGFDQIFMLYNPAVYDVADILDTYIYRVGISEGNFGLATAAGLFKSVVGVTLVIVANRIAKLVDKDTGLF